jgi:hypothetical protein
MPAILKRLVSQLKAKGMGDAQANATATKVLQKSGNLKAGTRDATKKGEARGKMGAAGRAKDRAEKLDGRPAKDHVYSKKTNRARIS